MTISSPTMSMKAVIIRTTACPSVDLRVAGDAMRATDAVSARSRVLPSAAGGTARPTTPASATMVSTYGIISTNCDGISLRALQLDLQRLRRGEQQAGERRRAADPTGRRSSRRAR